MWNLMTSNRILQMKMRRQAHLRHKNAIKNVKAQINITQPIKLAFLTNKLKTKYLASQQQREHSRNNVKMLQRMIEENKTAKSKSLHNFPKQSLNETQQRKTSDQITKQNKRLLIKLSSTSPSINFLKLQQQHRHIEKLNNNISRSRPKSGNSTNRTAYTRPKSSR